MDAQTREQLKAQHPDKKLFPIVSEEDQIEIIVQGAPPAVWAKFQSMARDFTDPAKRFQADELLVLGSLVYPDRETLRADLERRHLTGFYQSAARDIAKLTGARETVKMGEAL